MDLFEASGGLIRKLDVSISQRSLCTEIALDIKKELIETAKIDEEAKQEECTSPWTYFLWIIGILLGGGGTASVCSCEYHFC